MRLAMLLRDNPDVTFNGLSTYCRELTKELRKRHTVEWFIGKTDWETLKLGSQIPDRFNLVYATSLPYGGWVKLPMVAKCNSPLKEEGKYYQGLKRVAGFLGQYAEISTLNRARAVISVSKVSHDILKKKYSAESTIVPDGVDCEVFKPQKFSGKVVIAHPLRNERRKNPEMIERAKDFLKDRVVWESYPQVAHIFFAPSFSEAFDISLLEAMASGCACLASDIPAHRELIQHGKNGVLFNNEEEMKAEFDTLIALEEDRQNLGKAARVTAEQYPWSRSAELAEKVFLDAIAS